MKCRNKAVHYNIILYTSLQWLGQIIIRGWGKKIHPILRPHGRVMRIWKKSDRIITSPYCILYLYIVELASLCLILDICIQSALVNKWPNVIEIYIGCSTPATESGIMPDPNPLRWRHSGRDSVSHHQPHNCLLNHLFRRRSKKTSKLRVTGLCVGNSPGPVNSPHKGPVTRKMFPFDDVTMNPTKETFVSRVS